MSIETLTMPMLRIRMQNGAIKHHEWQTCLNCIEWSKDSSKMIQNPDGTTSLVSIGPQCMKYKMLPPPEVLVVGCENHDWDIPF